MFEITIGSVALVLVSLSGLFAIVSVALHNGSSKYVHDSVRPDYRI